MHARRGEMVEVALAVRGAADPFDPRVVAVDARISCPSGRVVVVPCFWGQAHERVVDEGRERWAPTAPAGFFLRVTPAESGPHEVEIVRTDPEGSSVVGTSSWLVAESDAPGLVRVTSGPAPRLVRDDGSRVTPIGMNLCWWISADPGVQMERVLGRMAEAGMTWVRLWLTHYGDGLTLEWDAGHPSGHFEGLGHYSLPVAARLDRFFAEAGRLGIDVQLVLWQHAQLASPSHSAWADNPYNAARGGPCATSADFFTDAEAARRSDQMLRLLAARYGAYPSLFAWEIFNEMDLVMDAPLDVVARWCADRARALRSLDAHGHLVTTSQAFPPSLVPPIAGTDALYDLVQCHVYAEDLADAIAREAPALARSGKPALASEVGLGPGGELDRTHPDGRYLHDATWAALAAGLSGGAMSWWWDSAIDARDWYRWQTAAARFVDEVDVGALGAPREGFLLNDAPDARVMGRVGVDGALAWIRAAGDVGVPEGALLVIPGLPGGEWRVEQWDTFTGLPSNEQRLRAAGALTVALCAFEHDTAVTVRRIR